MASAMYPGEIVLDDSTPDSYFDNIPDGFSTGHKGIFRSSQSADELSVPFPVALIIPKADRQGWIEEMEQRESRISDTIRAAGIRAKNQGKTRLCWAFAPVMLLMISRAVQNQAKIDLSPASVAGPVNGFQNKGGWAEDALRQLVHAGAVPSEFWPDTGISKNYYTPENIERAKENRAAEWWNLRPRNEDEHVSCLLRRIPVAAGLNYWEHEVADIDAVWVNGQIGVRFLNSWGEEYGAGGYGIRQGYRMFADDAIAIRSGTAS